MGVTLANLVLLVAGGWVQDAAAQGSVQTDRAALEALYGATDGPNWRNATRWLSNRPLGEWYGVTTDDAGRVVELNLGWGNLTGVLPPEIGNLTELVQLNLYDNFHLGGPLPPELGKLRHLQGLGITSTDFVGPLPSSLGNLTELRYLGLSWSRLRGPLPQSLTRLSVLDTLSLWETFLCAPANAAFQVWLEEIDHKTDVTTCRPATFDVTPSRLALRGPATQLLTLTQTGGSDPVSWTATGDATWLRVVPAAGIGPATIAVSIDGTAVPSGDDPATAAVILIGDGASVQVRVAAHPEGSETALSGSRVMDRTQDDTARQERRFDGQSTAHAERVEARDRSGFATSQQCVQSPGPCGGWTVESTAGAPTTDRDVLEELYHATGGSQWLRNTNWLSARPIEDWYGVTTNAGGRIVRVDLSDNGLAGEIPESLGNLKRLESLDLGRNALSGRVPASLAGLTRLKRLHLNYNQLTGAIPSALGALRDLESLNLQWNQFHAPIPVTLGRLSKLEVLNLEFALLTGRIPPSLGNLTRLKTLQLCDNFALTGSIPKSLGRLTRLEHLCLGGNELSGSIPAALGNLRRLTELGLQNNKLTGRIPPQLGRLTNLQFFYAHNNSLTGAIPAALGDLRRLTFLELHENRLTGPIPASLGNTGLIELQLYGNRLSGRIPPTLGKLDGLRLLYLQDNRLRGPIPATLGDLSILTVLDLRNNALTGPIPSALGRLTHLEVLDLSGNRLAGVIPRILGCLSRLWWLDVSDNRVKGSIPPTLGRLRNLVWLDLAGNDLSGRIPPQLGGLRRLRRLALSRNGLTGSIPATLARLFNLEELYVGENTLTGRIPAMLGNLSKLQRLYLGGNRLSGRIPARLGRLRSLEVLHLRENRLTGRLPRALGGLTALSWLDVAGNRLVGAVPAGLGGLARLRALSLSNNRLAGALPAELTGLSKLEYLWVGGTGLCAPAGSSFQTWLQGLAQFSGATCNGAAATLAGFWTGSAPDEALNTVSGRWKDTLPPVGQVDIPLQGATGVHGSIGVAGWIVDDVGVARVAVYRACLPMDRPETCTRLGADSLVHLADATLVAGVRPDVEAAYPKVSPPQVLGWGHVLPTHALPDVTKRQPFGGEGALALHVVATDVEGHTVVLGRSPGDAEPTRIVLANHGAERPFGVVETPRSEATVSGWLHTVGWALTPDDDVLGVGDVRVPEDGSTTVVYVDGLPVALADYGQCRGPAGNPVPANLYCDDDVANRFGVEPPRAAGTPRVANETRFRNLDAGRGPIGAALVDTTMLANGRHTLAWSVTDTAGRTSGFGIRYITVANGTGLPAGATRGDPPDSVAAGRWAAADVVIQGQQGWDPWAAWNEIAPDAAGLRQVTIPALGRLALRLGSPVADAYLLAHDGRRSLPLGTRLDPAAGEFGWGVGPAYLGTYLLHFVRPDGATVPVAVTVVPQTVTPGRVRGAIDTPRQGERVGRAFTVAGWAFDEGAWQGAGIRAVHVWGRRANMAGSEPVFLGSAAVGMVRPDVAMKHGSRYGSAGWTLTVSRLPPGVYDLTVYFEKALSDQVVATTDKVRVTVR